MRRLALLILLLGAPVTADAQFRDHATGLVISPPEDFYRQGEDLLAPASLISCWHASETADYPWVRICAERLDRLPRADEKLSFRWGDRTVKGARARVQVGGKDLMLYSALIPLRSGTIRLDVVTPVHGADDAKAYMEQTLATVRDEGRSVERSSAARVDDQRELRSLARLAGKSGMGLIAIGVGLWIKQRRAKKKVEAGRARD